MSQPRRRWNTQGKGSVSAAKVFANHVATVAWQPFPPLIVIWPQRVMPQLPKSPLAAETLVASPPLASVSQDVCIRPSALCTVADVGVRAENTRNLR